jgi:hypothetical protein
MKRRSIIKSFLSALFALIVLLTVNVHEVHYLFLQHEAHEHCENHLHSADEHDHCRVCKFDVSFFTDVIFGSNNAIPTASVEKYSGTGQFFNLQASFFNLFLRGPPSLA